MESGFFAFTLRRSGASHVPFPHAEDRFSATADHHRPRMRVIHLNLSEKIGSPVRSQGKRATKR